VAAPSDDHDPLDNDKASRIDPATHGAALRPPASNHFDDATFSATAYRAAFSYWGGLNRPATIDPYAIARVPVEHADTTEQFRLRLTIASVPPVA
jgi:hypothetical protein